MSMLSIASNAINNASVGAQTASKNIQNANTEGYAREVARFETGPSGHVYVNVSRMSDNFINNQYRSSLSTFSENASLSKYATLVNDIASGLTVDTEGDYTNLLARSYNDVYQSIITLSSDDSTSNRQALLSNLATLKESFASMETALANQGASIDEAMQVEVNTANDAIRSLNAINQKLISTDSRDNNDLLNRRDELLDTLSESLGIRVTYNQDGTFDVRTQQGVPIIDDKGYRSLSATYDQGLESFTLSLDRIALEPDAVGGNIAGLALARHDIVNQTQSAFGSLYYVIANELNQANRAGFTEDGTPGGDLITLSAAQVYASDSNSGAGSLNVSNIDLSAEMPLRYEVEVTASGYQITDLATRTTTTAATMPVDIGTLTLNVTGTPQVGDTYRIDPFAGAASTSSVSESLDGIALSTAADGGAGNQGNVETFIERLSAQNFNGGDESIGGYIDSTLANIGNVTKSIATSLKTSQGTMETSLTAKDQISGVSMNEENVSLIQFQSAYQAASKIIQTHTKLMDALMGAI